jgi:hypothetical protein
MLFLQVGQVAHLPPFAMQSFTGGYEIDAGGRIVPVPHNPFAAQVRGMPAELTRDECGELLGATTDQTSSHEVGHISCTAPGKPVVSLPVGH